MRFWPLRRDRQSALNTERDMTNMTMSSGIENKDMMKQLKERLLSEIGIIIDRAFADFSSLEALPLFQHRFTFNPPVGKEKPPFKSFVTKVLEKLRSEGKLEYRVVEGRPGEVVAVEFNPLSPEAKGSVERYASWVQRVSENEPM